MFFDVGYRNGAAYQPLAPAKVVLARFQQSCCAIQLQYSLNSRRKYTIVCDVTCRVYVMWLYNLLVARLAAE